MRIDKVSGTISPLCKGRRQHARAARGIVNPPVTLFARQPPLHKGGLSHITKKLLILQTSNAGRVEISVT